MGAPKAGLEWHGSTLLYRTVAVLARTVTGPVIVVRAPGQVLPALPATTEVVDDPVEGLGPLQGIATGLAAVGDRAPAAFVCATDLPFLHPAFVRRVLRGLGPDLDVALPVARGYPQPLAAAYRTTLASRVSAMVVAGRMRPAMLFADVRVLRLDDAALLADPALAEADPALDSLHNVNEPADYRAARERPAPEIMVALSEALAPNGHSGRRTIRAATLGAAANAVGLVPGEPAVVTLNGDRVGYDAELPLVAGDSVTFRSADTPS